MVSCLYGACPAPLPGRDRGAAAGLLPSLRCKLPCAAILRASLLSRCAPSATAAKPLRLRAPFSGPAGRKAVHSASCLSRLLLGAARFFAVTLRLFAARGFLPARAKPSPAFAGLGLSPSLQSIRAAHDGCALLCCHAADWPRCRVAFAPPRAKPASAVRRLGFCPHCAASSPARLSSALLCCHAARPPPRRLSHCGCARRFPALRAEKPSTPLRVLAACSRALRASNPAQTARYRAGSTGPAPP